MKQLRIFMGLKVKEIGAVLLMAIGMVYVCASIVVIKESLAVGFDIAIMQWPFYACIPGGLMIIATLLVLICLIIIAVPKWLRSNWKKAGEIAQRSDGVKYKCRVCGESWLTQAALDAHMRMYGIAQDGR